MDNPGLDAALWLQLDGRLWHATGRVGLRGIIADKEIRIGVGNRYVGSFCRNQGGVSLFDFGPASEDIPSQFNDWCGWLGHEQNARVAVWLEIDRTIVFERLMDAKATREALSVLMDQRRAEGKIHEPGITIIPGVEACHIGAIPIAAVAGVLLVDRYNWDHFQRLGRLSIETIQEIEAFEEVLPGHEEDPAIRILIAGRQRRR